MNTGNVEIPRRSRSRDAFGSTSLVDSFSRSVKRGWGRPDQGPAWSGPPAGATVNGEKGVLRVSAVPGGRFQHALLRTRDIELTARWALSALPEGAPVSVHFHTRVIGGGGQYRFYIAIMPSGDLLATLAKAEAGASSPLAGPIQVGSGYVPGKWWHVRVQATGSTPTTLRARVWKHGSPEPATWALELADGTAGLQADSHAVQIGVYARAGARSLPIEAMFDDVSVKGSI